MYQNIRSLAPDMDMLFVDDDSPDGTGEILDELAVADARGHVVHRARLLGIGSAHCDGICWAYKNHYPILITMDGDLSHSPKYFPEFLRRADQYDIVIGSRYVGSEGLKGWSLYRKMLTKIGHFFLNAFLNLPYDATVAFRLYRLDRIPIEIFHMVRSKGYAFFFESLYLLEVNGLKITEFPSPMSVRIHGKSKLSHREKARSIQRLTEMIFRTVTNKKS